MSGQRPSWSPTDAAASPRLTKVPRSRSLKMKDWLRQLATPTTAPASTHDSNLSFPEPTPRLLTERVRVSKRNEARSEGSDDRRSNSPGPISYIVVDADYSALGQAPEKSGAATPVGIPHSTSPQTRHSLEGRTGTYSTQGSTAFRAPSIGSWIWFKLIFQLRVWPALVYFANPRFLDKKKEALYRKEVGLMSLHVLTLTPGLVH